MTEKISTEEKILRAAEALFLKKGFAETKTRDIADRAGINLALLNYYYRSKEKLFNRIMLETIRVFMHTVWKIFDDEETSLEEKLELISARYIDRIKTNPDIPNFLLNELRKRPKEFFEEVNSGQRLQDFEIFNQLVERIGEDRVKEIDPYQIMMNLMSLTLFPFVGKPMLQMVTSIDDAEFERMMEERKKLIPQWVISMII